MSPSEVLGRALSAYFSGNTDARIIIHSPGFEPDDQAVSYYFRGWTDFPNIEKEAIERCSGSVLDIGAGAGAHSLILQERGVNVTALELSADACRIMKGRGVQKIVNQDIFEPPFAKFDTILMLMNGIGLVQSIEGLRKFLNHIRSYLKPCGQILFDSANLIYLFNDEDTVESVIDINVPYYGEVEFVMEFNGLKSDNFTWLYIDFDTLCHYAEEEGFLPELISQDRSFQYLASLKLV